MRKIKLSDICDIVIGRTPSRSVKEYWDVGSSWVSISDMKQKFISKTKEQITDFAISNARCRLVKKGTLLFSFKLTIGKLAFAEKDLYTNEAIAALPIKNKYKISSDYLYYALKTIRFKGSNQAVMGKTLNLKSLALIKVPIPEKIEDQIRIANILSRAEALIAKRKESIQLLDELLKSTFLDMFGDPVRNEKRWEKIALGNFGEIKTGNTPPRNNAENYAPNFIEWIKTDNIIEDRIFITDAAEYLSKSGLNSARKVEEGALLVACIAGSIESVGRAALTNRTVSFNQQINAIQPCNNISPLFLYWLFKISKKYIQNHATKGMKKILTKGEFQKIVMIKPPFELQTQFAQIVEKVENIKSKYQKSLQELENLYSSLSQKAFKGELDLSKMEIEESKLDIAAEEGVGYGKNNE